MISQWLSSPDNVGWVANLVTVVGLPLAIIGLLFVGKQMKNDRLSVSASAIGEMRASIMGRVDRIEGATKSGEIKLWATEVHEMFNDLEMACAIYLDGQMSGRTGRLAEGMIFDFLEMINNDEDLRVELEKAIHAPDTFVNIRDFRAKVTRDA